jgi:manganese peroxidase
MHIILLLLLSATSIYAEKKCPDIWRTISQDLTTSFVSGGECTDLARGAIRYAFHDAGTFSQKLPVVPPASGGADGSLLLNGGEIGRPENRGLEQYHAFITGKYAQYKSKDVGAADLIQFAGNHAVVSCPGGPIVRTLIGRKDSSEASPPGLLPAGGGPGSDHNTLLQLFIDKGFSAADLAALIGAHTTAKAKAVPQIPVGTPQDSTPGKWDVRYYAETYNPPPGVKSFPSDINLSNPNTTVGMEFKKFVDNQGRWNGHFSSAMFRLGMLGISDDASRKFVDCTDALPRTTHRRDMMGRPINFRFR